MPQIRYYAPTGVDSVTLTEGPTLYVNNGYITAGSKFAFELLKAGFTPATKGSLQIITDPITGSVSMVGPTGRALNYMGVKARFFASLPNGENYRSGEFLKAPPTWSTGISVASGYACTNAGNLYMCAYDGQLTSTVDPTHTAYNTVPVGADGVHWLYMGPAPTARADQADTPTYSIATVPAGCSAWIDPCPTNITAEIDYGSVFLSGSDWEHANADGGGVTGIKATNYQTTAFVDFCTDAPIFAMNRMQNAGSVSFHNNTTTINGFPIWPHHGIGEPLSVAYGSSTWLSQVYDFTSKPNRIRRIRQWMNNRVFTGVWVPPQYSVWKPSNPNRYRLYIEGDSFGQGGQSSNGQLRLPGRIAAALGCDDVWSTATGNTGYIWAAGGSTMQTRASKVIAAAPDILYCHGTEWDNSYTTAQRKTVYKLYWDTLLAALPNLIILVVGGRNPTGVTRTDMQAAISEYNHPHVVYIDAYGNTGTATQTLANQIGKGWFTGDGSLFTAGTVQGNTQIILGMGTGADEHPNARGDEVIARRVYDAIVAAMTDLKD